MKKIILSVFVGSCIGGILALCFVFFSPHVIQYFKKVFFEIPATVLDTAKKPVQNIFDINPNHYLIQTTPKDIASSTKVVYADLGSMKIMTYEQGQQVSEYPIRSVGREGTAWQTPIGTFDMTYKIPTHFSSIGHVWMPYSMHFFGNYFIHGWPYYADGTPVAEGYSGGCIRLNTSDAKQIYDFVDSKTELVIINSDTKTEGHNTDLAYDIAKPAPNIATPFLVADIQTGEVVAANNPREKISIDSFTNIMTALISLETLNQYQTTALDGVLVEVSEVLYDLLLRDSSEAAQILFEHKNKNQYIKDMNTRAQSLGMLDTTYVDTKETGVETMSSLEDTFRLMQHIFLYKPFVIETLGQDSYTRDSKTYSAIHPLRDSDFFVGGFSDTDNTQLMTLVSVDVLSSKTNTLEKKTFLILIQGDENATQDTIVLKEWIEKSVTSTI